MYVSNITINRKFEYKKLKKEEGKSRLYDTPSGRLPSVTTILRETGDKTNLVEWKKKVGKEKADLISRESINIGNMIHDHIEKHIEGKERPGGTNFIRILSKSMSDAIIDHGLKDVDEIWGYEESLYYPGLYAGTADLICVYKGKPTIVDFKSSKKIKKEEWIDDYFMQSIAYCQAHNEIYGTDISCVSVFMVDHNNNFKDFTITDNEKFKKFGNMWIGRLSEYYST